MKNVTATLVPGRPGTVELQPARVPAVAVELQLAPAIARVGQWLRRYDPADPRLPQLRQWYGEVTTGGFPRTLTRERLREWEELLGLGPQVLRQRPAGQLCDRCDFDGAPLRSQEVKGYGHRATCPQCGEAWVGRTSGEKASGASTHHAPRGTR